MENYIIVRKHNYSLELWKKATLNLSLWRETFFKSNHIFKIFPLRSSRSVMNNQHLWKSCYWQKKQLRRFLQFFEQISLTCKFSKKIIFSYFFFRNFPKSHSLRHYLSIYLKFDVAIATFKNLLKMAVLKERLNVPKWKR